MDPAKRVYSCDDHLDMHAVPPSVFESRLPRDTEAPIWQYGWGGYDAAAKKVDFHPMKTFVGRTKIWQIGDKLPDPSPELGFTSLHAEGGHPGRDAMHTAIRRWTAPRDGVIEVSGKL